MTEKTQEDEITEKINNIEIHYNVMAFPEWWRHGVKCMHPERGVVTLNIAPDCEYWFTNKSGEQVEIPSWRICEMWPVPQANDAN
ncbi:TPA: hypothetical protein RG728_003939 [Morganella morganii subsp. morganii]|uniref:DUF551 domain-containing protein n=1 Tax=Morganella morganii TaxID=582 RepID=A0AAU8ZMT0_MORMO|nr:hypothetical protein [Morganella morganii]AWC94440.1 hypothetical protein AM380_12670 [Morganella morganii]HDU8694764.1 hypothetical protein [Morganella morganii subsp. morganii]